ncbi:DUF3106 domain-containing protein [Comamonas sp. J-3]|uniref:DUF3106 domain-containing protein n=1 Tax=Comamonas trifloxystrobinivorans TaxID=3350256 RepID=UPI00372B8955
MRHEQDFDEAGGPAPTTSSLPTIAASILLAAFAVAGVMASKQARNVYGSAPSDLVSANSVTRSSAPRNEGPQWDALEAEQQATLAPLQEQWSWLTEQQKRRWLLIADSFDDFSPEEQLRIAEHMKEWARFSLADQSQARLNYSTFGKLSAEEKRRLWEDYLALSARERKRLAQGGLLRPGGVALAPRPNANSTGRLVKVPAAAINPNRANPPKILPPPEIRIQSRGVVTPVEVGPLPAAPVAAPSPAPATTPAPAPTPAAETAPVQVPAPVTPAPLPPMDLQPLPAPSEPQSRTSDTPVHPPA